MSGTVTWIVTILTLLASAVMIDNSTDRKPSINDNIPLPNASSRPQLLQFGMYVTPDPDQNPIDPPERFTGYHTALDLEILPGEENQEIPVAALCDGRIILSETVEGYGGVAIQSCRFENEDVTVLYGHLEPTRLVTLNAGIKKGDQVGILAPAKSPDSGYTRKHLHLGIHKGPDIDIRGYVQNEAELANFIDPRQVLDF